MPKRRRQEGKVQHKHKRKPKVGDDVKGAGYTPIVKENARFVKYYQGLGVVPAEEWEDFMSVMRRPLPSTFRITGTRHQATAVRQCLQQTFFTQLAEAMQQGGEEGEELAPPTPFPWYPNNLAWHIPLSKAFIRKSPEVAKFHRFLVDESDQGNISRQEAVSMIPPLLLDVQPHHKVLDMCAAPGSKTAQLIEMIHANDLSSPSVSSLPAGVVVANDADNKRCYMLVHQAKRLKSPCFMVTNHDASVFPMLYYHDENDVRHPLHYDRVVCDVPCSGDGTMRKNPTIWRSWNPALGAALHKLQLRILNRGLELLVPGGRLVYSTCSLNPVENEAVISTMLQLCKGSVELLDVSSQLPGLKTISGMTSWKVMNRKCEWETVDATTAAASTLFPPESSLLPHLNLHRWPGHRQGARGRVYREDPYVFLTGESEVWKLIKPYYGLADTFPYSQLLTRTVTGKKRNIYLTSSLVKELLHRNELHVKFINVGVKVLARCDNYNASCPFRLCQEGIESLVAFITNNRLSLTLDDLVLVLKEPNPLSVQLAQETQDALSSLGVGPALFDYIPSHSKQTASTLYDHPIYLSGWVARKSVRLYVDKKYRCHYLAMLGHEPPLTMSLASVSAGTREGERVEVEEWKMQEEERSGYEGEEREVDQVVVVGTDMIEDISEGCGDKV